MKNIIKLVLVSLLSVAGTVGTMELMPKPELAPEQMVEVGTQFDMPCPEHGKHVVTVESTEVVRFYSLNRDDGATGFFSQEDLLGLMIESGVTSR